MSYTACTFKLLLAERINRSFEFMAAQTDAMHAIFRDVAGFASTVYEISNFLPFLLGVLYFDKGGR